MPVIIRLGDQFLDYVRFSDKPFRTESGGFKGKLEILANDLDRQCRSHPTANATIISLTSQPNT